MVTALRLEVRMRFKFRVFMRWRPETGVAI